jgi:hypothetical protein
MASDRLDGFWNEYQTLPVVEQIWPVAGELAALEALRTRNREQAGRLERDFDFNRHFARLPIVAVAGLKNAGKSTLIASFLTAENRKRIPRGLARDRGTQRFTLWLPASWEADVNLLPQIKSRLADVFGHAVEALAADGAEAIRQQTLQGGMERPLLAFDAALDSAGIALLDCPDIETAHGDSRETNARLEMLARARDFCAGVIIVLTRERIEVSTVEVIHRHLPQATRIYVINKIGEEPAEAVATELAERLGSRPELCYGAYDYRLADYTARAPDCDPNKALPSQSREVPFFFEITSDNAPGAIGESRSILHLSERIPPAVLQQRSQSESLRNFVKESADGLSEVELAAEAGRGDVEKAADELFKAVRRLRTKDGKLKFKPDAEILDQMQRSIARSAPWWLPVRMGNGLRAGVSWIGRKLTFMQRFGKAEIAGMRETVEKWAAGSGEVADEIAAWARLNGGAGDAEKWKADAEEIMRRFNNEERSNLSEEEWTVLTKEFWQKAPKLKAASAIIGTFVAGLALTAWLVFEPVGGTLAAKILAGKLILGVNVGEFLACVGLGGLAGTAAAQWLSQGIESKIGLQQVSNLYAIAADRLGVPRDVPPAYADQFPPPRIAEKPHREAWGVRERHWQIARLHAKNLRKLRDTMKDLIG